MSVEGRTFLDTNVLVYLLSSDDQKADIAEALLASTELQRVISTQVINEFVNTARRKARLEWAEVRFQVATFRQTCAVRQLTDGDQDDAFEIADAYGFGWHDSLIVASALGCGASILLSEDFQDGQSIDGLTIANPFGG